MEDNKKKVIKTIILVVCIIVFLVSAGFIGKYFYDKYKIDNNLDDLREEITEPTTLEDIIIEEPKPDYSEVVAKNNETVGWIKVNGTSIDYPIVQSNDNKYYLYFLYLPIPFQ